MRIWLDILTPKQLLFFEALAKLLEKKHELLCTSRSYSEVIRLARLRNFKLESIGAHGGSELSSKLESSIDRMRGLLPEIRDFAPELLISFCSPEASRIAFGLGIRNIGFSDSPHATAVMRLTVPLADKLLIPWIIPKSAFSCYGISKSDIIQYRCLDAAVTIGTAKRNFTSGKKILVRTEEEQAAYQPDCKAKYKIISQLTNDFDNVTIISRYHEQTTKLKKRFGKSATVLQMQHQGTDLLAETDVFVGSGGTMTAEAALMGIPTISYNAAPNLVEKYLVGKRLVLRETDPVKLSRQVRRLLHMPARDMLRRSAKLRSSMESPWEKLLPLLAGQT